MSCSVEVILPCLIFVKVTVVANCVETSLLILSVISLYSGFQPFYYGWNPLHVFMVNVSYHIFKLAISGSRFYFVIFLVLVFAKIKFYIFKDSDKLKNHWQNFKGYILTIYVCCITVI